MSLHNLCIIYDAWLKVVDAPLTVIFRRHLHWVGNNVWLHKGLIDRLYSNVTIHLSGLFMTQCEHSLTLNWPSFLECGNELVISLFCYNANQYIPLEIMWQCSPLIAKCVRQKIVHTPLTLSLITSKHPLYNQSMYATNHIQITDIPYSVCS
jgi:hypothetical protein